jgi:hypothetical protein
VFFLSDQDVLGAESLLTKYISQLCNHITETLPIASSLAATSSKHFSLVVSILKGDVIGMYFGGYFFLVLVFVSFARRSCKNASVRDHVCLTVYASRSVNLITAELIFMKFYVTEFY